MPVFGAPPAEPLPWIRLQMTAGMTVVNNTATKLSFDQIGGSFAWPAPTLPVTALPMPLSGLIEVSAFDCDWGDTSAGAFEPGLGVKKNDNAAFLRYGSIVEGNATTGRTTQSVQRRLFVAAGDTLPIVVSHNFGSDLTGVALADLFVSYLQLGTFTTPTPTSFNF